MNTIIKIFIFLIITTGVCGAIVYFGFDADSASTQGDRSFYSQFVIAGGPIVWFVLLPLSIATIYIAIDLMLSVRRKKLVPAGIGNRLLTLMRQQSDNNWMVAINKNDDLVSTAVRRIMSLPTVNRNELEYLLAESVQNQVLPLYRQIEWANIIGNVAPMIGLFGTVFGMIKAFNGIVIAGGQPQPAHLAEGISLALVTTFWGLLIAIPAMAIHGIFSNRLESFAAKAIDETEITASQLKQILKTEKQFVRKRFYQGKNNGGEPGNVS